MINKLCLYDLIHFMHDNANLVIFVNSKLIYVGQAKNCYKEVDKKVYEMPISTINSDKVDNIPVIALYMGD